MKTCPRNRLTDEESITVKMNSTFLQLVSGCSFRGKNIWCGFSRWCKTTTVGTRAGFQSFLRRSEGGGRAEDGASDADWSSGGGGVFYCYFPPTPHGTFIKYSPYVQGPKKWVTLKRLHQTKLQHPHLINLHPDLHTTDLVKTD